MGEPNSVKFPGVLMKFKYLKEYVPPLLGAETVYKGNGRGTPRIIYNKFAKEIKPSKENIRKLATFFRYNQSTHTAICPVCHLVFKSEDVPEKCPKGHTIDLSRFIF